MSKEKKKNIEKIKTQEGYKPLRRGYQPSNSKLNLSEPPKSGSGITNGSTKSDSSNNTD
jgi:hypothetical protein